MNKNKKVKSPLDSVQVHARDWMDVEGDALITSADFHNGTEDPWNRWCEPCEDVCTGECLDETPVKPE